MQDSMFGFEKQKNMPTNQEFVVGKEITIILTGGDEVDGIIDAVEMNGTDALLRVDVAGIPRTFTYTEGVWAEVEESAREFEAAA